MRWLLLLLLFALPASAAETPDPVQAALTRMGEAYEGVHAVRGDFTQTTTGMSYIEPLVQSGTIQLEAPGKMRWEFVTPRKQVYQADGKTLWVVDEGDRTTTRFSSIDGLLKQIYGFLTGSADLRSEFTVSLAKDAPKGLESAVGLSLVPRQASGSYESLRLYLDAGTHRVLGVSTLTPFGDRTDMLLRGVEVVDDLPDEGFVYSERPGFRMIQGD